MSRSSALPTSLLRGVALGFGGGLLFFGAAYAIKASTPSSDAPAARRTPKSPNAAAAEGAEAAAVDGVAAVDEVAEAEDGWDHAAQLRMSQVFMRHEERRESRRQSDRVLPMVLITGFLGSGKACTARHRRPCPARGWVCRGIEAPPCER